MAEEQRLNLEDLLPKDTIIWADDSELDWWKDDPWTYRKWARVAGHGPMAGGKGCERCGYDTSQCMFAVFHDAMVTTVIRELDKLGLLTPPAVEPQPAPPRVWRDTAGVKWAEIPGKPDHVAALVDGAPKSFGEPPLRTKVEATYGPLTEVTDGPFAVPAPADDEAAERVRTAIWDALKSHEQDGPTQWFVDDHAIDCNTDVMLDVVARAALAALKEEQQP